MLKFEEAGDKPEDPYVCFRRREIRSTRKTRRADAVSLHKLRQLKGELDVVRSMLEMVMRREKMRWTSVCHDQLIFEQKIRICEMKTALGVPEEIIADASRARVRYLELEI